MQNDKQIYFDAAAQIGNKLCRDAIWDGNRCNWILSNMDMKDGHQKIFFQSGPSDVYNGTAGIALFLAAVYSVNKDAIIRATAYGALRQAVSRMHKNKEEIKLGFYSGNLGIVYAMIELGKAFNDKDLLNEGLQEAIRLTETPVDELLLDVIDGCAGAIPVLLNLYREHKTEQFKKYAVRLGDHLVQNRRKENTGVSWDTTTTVKKQNLTGYAHGVAGVSNALFELYRFTGAEKYKQAGEAGIAYENACFNKQEQNWCDFRNLGSTEGNADVPCSCAWCHGAPGIGLSRLRAFEITGNTAYKDDALIAIDTTRKNNHPVLLPNFSLCHGLMGNADLLIEASRVFSQPELLAEAEAIGNIGINDYLNESLPLVNGLNNTFDNPELMTGASGMGYFYLRLYDADKFPSLLCVKQLQTESVA